MWVNVDTFLAVALCGIILVCGSPTENPDTGAPPTSRYGTFARYPPSDNTMNEPSPSPIDPIPTTSGDRPVATHQPAAEKQDGWKMANSPIESAITEIIATTAARPGDLMGEAAPDPSPSPLAAQRHTSRQIPTTDIPAHTAAHREIPTTKKSTSPVSKTVSGVDIFAPFRSLFMSAPLVLPANPDAATSEPAFSPIVRFLGVSYDIMHANPFSMYSDPGLTKNSITFTNNLLQLTYPENATCPLYAACAQINGKKKVNHVTIPVPTFADYQRYVKTTLGLALWMPSDVTKGLGLLTSELDGVRLHLTEGLLFVDFLTVSILKEAKLN
ncbi:proteoglycan 4-like [Paramacrobiotus metropolitanus]|uniref:proteoglycan 4-like n=1 Tax=Paramacrobiotus metropolitanus TaxID=2943436 RepID=UPI0024461BA6|nr:proteoglycan 4-like [Paramacrobiotus metropolitanus]